MNVFTFLNITADNTSCVFVYIFSLFVESALAFTLLHFYRVKYESFKESIDPSTQELDDIAVSHYAVQVKGLPTGVGVEELQKQITNKMYLLYPVDP